METTAADEKSYKTKFYSLDAIIAVGYRVNSYQATQFRIWATKTLKEFVTKGFVMDDHRHCNYTRLRHNKRTLQPDPCGVHSTYIFMGVLICPLELAEKEKLNAVELAKEKAANESQKTAAAKQAEIQELKAQLDKGEEARKLASDLQQAKHATQTAAQLAEMTRAKDLQEAAATKDAEIQTLKAQLESNEVNQKLAINEAVGSVEKGKLRTPIISGAPTSSTTTRAYITKNEHCNSIRAAFIRPMFLWVSLFALSTGCC